ncbi:MAG: Flp family type IVb pilin [Pseudolabrys sp.]|jgi:pilus assembly protein Flp/PilA
MSKTVTTRTLKDFFGDENGATAIEYAMIASGVAGAIIAVVFSLGTSVKAMFTSVSSALD